MFKGFNEYDKWIMGIVIVLTFVALWPVWLWIWYKQR
jgi:hypothetical protein